MTKPVRSSGLTLPFPGTRSCTHSSIASRCGNATPSSTAASAATPATPPDDAITATPHGSPALGRQLREQLCLVEQLVDVACGDDAQLAQHEVVDPALVGDRARMRTHDVAGPGSVRPSFSATIAVPEARPVHGHEERVRRSDLLDHEADDACGRVVREHVDIVVELAHRLVSRRHRDAEPELALLAGCERRPEQEAALRDDGDTTGVQRDPPAGEEVRAEWDIQEATAVRPDDRHPAGFVPSGNGRRRRGAPGARGPRHRAPRTRRPRLPRHRTPTRQPLRRRRSTARRSRATAPRRPGRPTAERLGAVGTPYTESRLGLTRRTSSPRSNGEPASSIGSTALFDMPSFSLAPTTATVDGFSRRARSTGPGLYARLGFSSVSMAPGHPLQGATAPAMG